MNRAVITERLNTFIDKTPNGVKSFFYSDWYLAIIAVSVFISWLFDIPVLGFAVVILLATVVLVVLDDVLPLIAILFCIPFTIADNADISRYYPLIAVLVPMILAMVFHVVHYKPKKLTLGKLGVPQLLITGALLLGGCTSISAASYLGALPYTLLLGLGVLVIYIFAVNYVKENSLRDSGEFLARAFLVAGLILVAEMITYYVRLDLPASEWGGQGWIDLGWGIDNNVATLLLLSAPMCFFLATRKKHPTLYMLIGLIQYVTIVFTYSRGGLLFAAVTAPLSLIFCIIKPKNRKESLIVTICVLALVAAGVGVLFDKILTIIAGIFRDGLSSSSRVALYLEACEVFRAHPIFGGGTGFNGVNYDIFVMTFYWFHSTFFQIIGSMGLVGVATYSIFYYRRVIVHFSGIKKDTFLLFAFVSVLGFELYSLIDTGTFVPLPSMMLVVALTAVLEKRRVAHFSEEQAAAGVTYSSNEELTFAAFRGAEERAYGNVKYLGDRLFSLLGLIILSPVLALTALIIKLDSPGKAVIKQERTGKNGQTFLLYKFRTMKSDDVPFDKEHPVIASSNENLTRVGRWIRKFKLDEFLQLVNVLKGDMSLVGPRPLRTVYLADYKEWEREKLEVLPGMSGLAQVRGNGYLSSAERSFYDVEYRRKFSMLLDFEILVKTIGVMLVGEEKFLRHVPEEKLEALNVVTGAPETADDEVNRKSEEIDSAKCTTAGDTPESDSFSDEITNEDIQTSDDTTADGDDPEGNA